MWLLDRIFSNQNDSNYQPSIRFGRFSDSYKPSKNYDAWDDSLEKFEKQDYIGCYRSFFDYLRDEQEDNVKYWEVDEGIEFEFYQGSKRIFGHANTSKLKAEAKIAKAKGRKKQFMYRLLEQNFNLQYSRFAIDHEDTLTIIFDTYSLDGSPYKLYYALKELATNADKQDDLLLDEFKSLEQVGTDHLKMLPAEEKLVKYNYVINSIEKALNMAKDEQLCQEYPGGIAYLLLNLVYKLDYLIKPEGYMMEALERANRLYFANDNKNTFEKIKGLQRELELLASRPREGFFREMYRGISTFGITAPVNHDHVVNLINHDLGNMDWYRDNGYEEIALSIPGYIIGYCMFNYAIPKPDRDLFHLYFQITEAPYFNALGFKNNYYSEKEAKLQPKYIRKAIEQIVTNNRKDYIHLAPHLSLLRYESMCEFAKSFLIMVRDLDLT